jgi:predicted negative regulator of RcsB-dependent stress response
VFALLADQYAAAGRFEDALHMNGRALEVAKLYPEQQPGYIPGLAALMAQSLVSLGRFDEAEKMLAEAKELAQRYAPDAREMRMHIALSLGNLHLDRQQFDDAVVQYEGVLELVGERSVNRALVAGNLAYALAQLGRFDEALARAAEAIDSTKHLGADAPPRVGIQIYAAEVHRLAGKKKEAHALFLSALPVLDRIEADPSLRFMGYFGAAQVEPDSTLARTYGERAAEALDHMPALQWQREALATWRARG